MKEKSLLKVLLVENDPIDQKAFTRFVEQENLPYKYTIVQSSADARSILKLQVFDVVLLDFNLDDGNSFVVLPDVPSQTPVIFTTGSGSEEIAIEAMRRGASDYLIKDIDRTYLKLLPVVIDRAIRQKANEKQRQILSQAVMSSGESIFITDLEFNITFVNAAFCQLFDYATENIVGKNAKMLYPLDDQVLTSSELHQEERILVRYNGTKFTASITQTPIVNSNRHALAYVTIVRDLTEQKNLINSLESFAHTVAHDLKNPTSQILGYANIMADAFDDFEREDLIDYLRTIERQSAKMVKIIDALLLLASTQRLTDIPIVNLDMAAIVTEVLQRLDPMIQESGARITVQSEFPTVIGYTPWVEEILVNYMSNAIKYGGQPPSILVGSDAAKSNSVRFWVRDNGRGLTSDEQRQLFQLFKRVTQAKIEGHGLGLSIVRQIVERLGGEVDVKSEIGRGSEFGFTLPVA